MERDSNAELALKVGRLQRGSRVRGGKRERIIIMGGVVCS
jgi:hypothetical protein